MTTPSVLADGRTRDYACGLAVPVRNGEPMFEHSGAVSGFSTFNAMIPRTRSALVLMTNGEHLDAGSLNRTLVTLLLEAEAGGAPAVPTIKGPAPKEVALDLLHQLQAGEVKRDALGEEFSHFLTPARVAGAKERLKALGEPDKVEVETTYERGGMEVAVVRFTFKTVKAKALLYRTPDGKIQEFLLTKSCVGLVGWVGRTAQWADTQPPRRSPQASKCVPWRALWWPRIPSAAPGLLDPPYMPRAGIAATPLRARGVP